MSATHDIQANKALLTEFQKTLAQRLRGEPADIRAYFHNDIAWHFPKSTAEAASGSDHYGIDAVMAMFGDDVGQFYQQDTMTFHYHAITAEEDRVHLHFSLEAKTATGEDYYNDYQSLFRMADGKIIEVWEYFDTAYLFSLFTL
ncbi:ketosteroid isomerase-like protein [Litorivivens lipolytica]|uniref:Ketosteroid isomerase-like protein n=1 Tax=Litorivivens lipolytica TaxID=1524264 RepID=A0A7W4W2G8_9GAMM|nr:nuclear transport factor 2 family protein [Litorivivens lipolytica]MBB3046237.1 ketosteroid isomerase-like protein [Litorivivens lipolytica]